MSERKVGGRGFEWDSLAATLSFIGAAFTGLFGFLLTTSWIVVPSVHPQLRDLGIVFLILALPLLILGGHCLDLMEQGRHHRHTSNGLKHD